MFAAETARVAPVLAQVGVAGAPIGARAHERRGEARLSGLAYAPPMAAGGKLVAHALR